MEGLDLGKVQAVEFNYVRTVKGLISKETFFIPRELAEAFDGSTLWFCVPRGLEGAIRRAHPPTEAAFARPSPARPPNARFHGGRASRGLCPVHWTSSYGLSIA
jgi:hypothetical protein